MKIKAIDKGVMVKVGNRLISTEAYLRKVNGGYRVDYIDSDGTIVKTEPLSRSPYHKKSK